ncbi:hypothetical protein ACQEVX_23095 [Streptomyces syringium]|uniref:hypothetical protein n=1 Tax=Streptomyces syringium TaxID=76729 RepID=UPI003D91327E
MTLTNVGNRDLDTSHFGGQAIEFTSSARVVDVLAKLSSPSSQRVIPVSFNGNRLDLTPGTLHRRQALVYRALVDGADPTVDAVATLSNGDFVRHQVTRPDESAFQRRVALIAAAIGVVASVASAAISAFAANR